MRALIMRKAEQRTSKSLKLSSRERKITECGECEHLLALASPLLRIVASIALVAIGLLQDIEWIKTATWLIGIMLLAISIWEFATVE